MSQKTEPEPTPQEAEVDYNEKGQQSVWGLIAEIIFGGKG